MFGGEQSLFAQPVIWVIVLVFFSFLISFIVSYIFWKVFPRPSRGIAGAPTPHKFLGVHLPAFTFEGPPAVFIISLVVCIAFSMWLLTALFERQEKDVWRLLQSHNLTIEDASRELDRMLILESEFAKYPITAERLLQEIRRLAEIMAMQEQLIGQYCWFANPDSPSPHYGTVSITPMRTSGIRLEGVYITEKGRIDFSSRRLAIDETGIAYDWKVESPSRAVGTVIGFSLVDFIERSDKDNQLIAMKGWYSLRGNQDGSGSFYLVRRSPHYGVDCDDILTSFFRKDG